MRTAALAILGLALTTPVAALAANSALPLPAHATLIGMTAVSEIRQFPEENASGNKAGAAETQHVQGADRLFETTDSYPATVVYFDHNLGERHFVVRHRVATHTSTVWALSGPDGSPARLAVRNTNPTTFEWVSAHTD